MTPPFVRRAAACAGLLALLPTGVMLARGELAPLDAGVRGVVTLVFVRGVVSVCGVLFRRAAHAAARSSWDRDVAGTEDARTAA
jgi:hypothetical protein